MDLSQAKGAECQSLSTTIGLMYPKSGGRVFLTCNGRSAIYLYLKSLSLPEGSEILVQSFTCNAVINPILWLGLTPVFVDIARETLSMDPHDLQKKITDRSRVVILQHTLGHLGESEKVAQIAKKNRLRILEDCAHSLGCSPHGTFGDAAILSFGLEKSISSRAGGALLLNSNEVINSTINEYSSWKVMSRRVSAIWLLNPYIWLILRKIPSGRDLAVRSLTRLGILNLGYYKSELDGVQPSQYPRKLSNNLAKIVNSKISEISSLVAHRINISNIYQDRLGVVENIQLIDRSNFEIPYLRFPIISRSGKIRDKLLAHLRTKGYYIGEWYSPAIYPKGTSFKAMKYDSCTTPTANEISARILNLPTSTFVDERYATLLCDEIIAYVNKNDT